MDTGLMNDMKTGLFIFLIGVVNLIGRELYIVKNGAPFSYIVIDPESEKVGEYAAQKLQLYISKISGVEIPLIMIGKKEDDLEKLINRERGKTFIFVGESSFSKKAGISIENLKPDGFKIITKNNFLFLIGKDYKGDPINIQRRPYLKEVKDSRDGLSVFGPTGTVFAVYYFLESLGIRWFMPGEIGEVIPKKKNIVVKELNIEESPAFEYRYLHGSTFSSNRFFPEGCEWFKKGRFGSIFPVPINHSFFYMNKYKDIYPEIFAIIGGERDFGITCIGEGSLCLSEKKTLELFVEEARAFFNKYPKERIFPVVPNDDYRRICECEKCKGKEDLSMGEEGKFSDYVWGFVNEVAKEVYKTHPDKFIGCIAYGHYLLPPKKIKMFNPNVAVMICKTRANYWDKKYKERMDNLIKEWKKKVEHIYIWEYYNWYSPRRDYHELRIPVMFFRTIKEDLKFLKKLGIKGEFIEVDDAYNISPGLLHLPIYITGRLLWNPDEDLEKILDDYYEKFYGPAKKEMKKFFEKAEEIWMLPFKREDIYSTKNKKMIEELISVVEEAKKEVSENSLYKKRIELISDELSFLKQYIMLENQNILPIYFVNYITTPPVIDGKLEEDIWKKNEMFRFYDQISGGPPYEETEGCIVYDEKNLYLGFKCYLKKEKNRLRANIIKKDDPRIWKDDCIEIFLDPTGNLNSYFHFIINSQNATLDAKYIAQQGDPTWNSNFKSSVFVGENYWSVEMCIPFEDIGFIGRYIWRGNFVRHHSINEDEWKRSCWSPTLTTSSHRPMRFGKITFKKNN